jgi:hypothetical protein
MSRTSFAHSLSRALALPLGHPLACVAAAWLPLSLAMLLLLSLSACAGDLVSPGSSPVTSPPASSPVSDTVQTIPLPNTPTPTTDSGPRTLLLELQRVGGTPLPVTVLDRTAAEGGTPRLRLDAYAGSLQLFPDGTYRNGVALTVEVDGEPQPVRVVHDSGTYRVGAGRITLVSRSAAGGVRTVELGPDSTWTMEQAPAADAAPARFQYGTAATRPPVMPLSGAWSFAVSNLTDGAVSCTLRGFGWQLTERDGAVTGESTASGAAGAGMDCRVVGRVPPFVTPTYGAGMPVTGRIVGDRVVLESRSEDGEGNALLVWRAEGRVVASSTQMWSHVEGTLTVRERDGGTLRTYAGSFVMRRR